MANQSLSLAQTQRLQMMLAPQLRQSLEMLQLPMLELRAMIQKELEQNPTLEEGPLRVESIEVEPGLNTPANSPTQEQADFDKEFEVLAKLDEEWRDYFLQDAQSNTYSSEDEERRQYLFDSLPQKESLQEHLLQQLTLTGLSESDRQIGELVIGSIDDDGYLTSSPEELASSTGSDPAHVADIVAIVQEFHPTGVGARDLRDCLLIQLDRLGKTETLPYIIVRDHLDLLGQKKYSEIARATKCSAEEVLEAAKLIASLDPKPGRIYSDEGATYIHPEIVVQKVDGRYVIVLNDEQLPHVRISNHYRQLLQDPATTQEVRGYVQERIRSGAFLIKSIHQRQKTIHRISSEIVSRQSEFFENGITHLKPLTMAEVAASVGVHETTVSRAVSGKYMKTPLGSFELKYFFTPGIKTADGTEISNKTVKDMIHGMVSAEDPSKPLSDQEIMDTLKAKGIQIARRTIAKYRLMLRIPPSHLRKGF